MKRIFLDTSSLIKLYIPERGSLQLMKFIADNKFELSISDLTRIELYSAINKLVRMKNLSERDCSYVDFKFSEDLKKFKILRINETIILQSINLVKKYSNVGLRSLDAIQMASALNHINIIYYFSTHDKKLAKCMNLENMNVVNYD